MIEYCTRSIYNNFKLLQCEVDWNTWHGINLSAKGMNFDIEGAQGAWIYRIDDVIYKEINTEFCKAWDRNIMWSKLGNEF